MVAKFLTFFGLVAAAAAIGVPVGPVSKLVYAQPEAPAQYDFSYSVHDSHTGDIKQQQESRRGDAVQGSYSLVQPDGVQRIVEYTADDHQGFNAIVRYEGTPVQAAPVTKIGYAAPITKVAYPQAPIAYAAPAPVRYVQAPAQVAYATAPANFAYGAPSIAKLAYSENLGRVSFASPYISYQH